MNVVVVSVDSDVEGSATSHMCSVLELPHSAREVVLQLYFFRPIAKTFTEDRQGVGRSRPQIVGDGGGPHVQNAHRLVDCVINLPPEISWS